MLGVDTEAPVNGRSSSTTNYSPSCSASLSLPGLSAASGEAKYKMSRLSEGWLIEWNPFNFRNLDKKSSLSRLSQVILILRTIMDSSSRVLIFSTWLYVTNDGRFSSLKTLLAYYFVFTGTVIFIFNIVFSESRNFFSATFWIGIIYHTEHRIFMLCFATIWKKKWF